MRTATPAVLLGLMLAAPACAEPAPPAQEGPRLVLTGVGRFAVLADLSTIARDGDTVRMRSLQVAEEDFRAGGQTYWGGWSWWAFDCRARTADRLDFASVREGGAEGPATRDAAPAYPAAPGGDAAELLAVACDPASAGEADADNLEDAVRIGRRVLAGAG
ncbi:surface-adhesin E family protein [Brevundimonas sp.]|uniref:surface-adhesin E family protein n=1 Tax=Brevundimonas sp. TaxID=1871086 RepID=UPI002D4AB5DF|nr:surface-adhesin E family protein [Brevundimonas sp.]HYC96690.1 surface-adhesin E family protein [Brevundimonas sp.]